MKLLAFKFFSVLCSIFSSFFGELGCFPVVFKFSFEGSCLPLNDVLKLDNSENLKALNVLYI